MQYRLRTLLILLAIGPAALAGAWWGYGEWQQWRVQQWYERALREGRLLPAPVPDPEAWEDAQKASPDEN